ncbi:MAG: UDP-3-O-(3-hydroxymyristoyl)glucosamine N-acyltransferase [Saprospiraceae bacterium]|nr:UDP-3-O-(3-hydroxymyristoyl)glucosamine N-acyltransferase [Saprospiraceae bacterium]
MQLSASEIAQLLNGSVEGDPQVKVNRPSKIEEGGIGTITFLANSKYEEFAYTTTASVLLVSRGFVPKQQISATLIRVDDVYNSISFLLEKFGNQVVINTGISSQAFIHPTAKLGQDVSVEMFSVIEEGVIVGDGSRIASQVYIGRNVELGKNVILYPGVKIMQDCKIGDNCIIHPNVVIGGDGFGFAPQANGSYKKVPQTGNVVIESDVEIGAGTTIDRATMGSTIIRSGVKLDNLIQIAHNVEIGENTVIAAQAGIAGSTKIGKNCRIGGQVGFAGHIIIADGTQIQAQSGIASSIEEPNTALFGSPAIGYKDYIRSYAVFKKLPELYRLLAELEKQVKMNGSPPE